MRPPTTRQMSDKHEKFLAEHFQGRRARGSGNQFNDQMDGRNQRYETPFALAWDGKSSLTKSMSISRQMWEKAVEQAAGELPLLALRFYDTYRLDVGLDLVVLDAHDFVSILTAARQLYEYPQILRLRRDVKISESELEQFEIALNNIVQNPYKFGIAHVEADPELPQNDRGDTREEHSSSSDPGGSIQP